MNTLELIMTNINNDDLIAYGGITEHIKKGEMIFREGDNPYFYYQLIEGEVKMISVNQQGKELLQKIFNPGESFGEPPLFINKPYPSSSIALKDSIILKLSKAKLDVLLQEKPTIAISIIANFAERIYQKTLTNQILATSDPEEKIIALLDRIKKDDGSINPIKIPYTRQQIANSTGLCVETVIRALIKLDTEKVVEIKKHKVYY